MQDWAPTLMAAAGEPDVKEKLKNGHNADGKKFKVHLDGFSMKVSRISDPKVKRLLRFLCLVCLKGKLCTDAYLK